MVLIHLGAFALFTRVAGNEETCIMGDVVTLQKVAFYVVTAFPQLSQLKYIYLIVLF